MLDTIGVFKITANGYSLAMWRNLKLVSPEPKLNL